MKKGTIYILLAAGEWIKVKKEGYIDSENQIGYWKKELGKLSYWQSVELNTGLKIAECETRKMCISETEKLMPRIKDRRESKDYKTMVRRFQKAKERKI